MSKYLIYALKDPRNNEIRYIGKSSIGMDRPKQHNKPSELIKKTHKTNWIKSLKNEGLDYIIEVLENCESEEQVMQQEIYWIKFHKELGTNLTNLTDGGEGNSGWVMPEETKKKY